MSTFAETVDQIDSLSKEEIVEMKRIIERKGMSLKEQEILDAVEQARKDKAEGKTIVLSSPEEIKDYFAKMLENAD